MSRTIFILAFVVLAVATDTFALKCYSCVNCNDKFSSNGVSTNPNCTTCSKVKQGGIITRGCGGDFSSVCISNVTITECICSTDLCNGGSHVTVTMGTMLLGTAIMILKNLY